MRTLYIDCGMGAAGDMLTAALLELLPDREGFLKKMNGLGIPGVTIAAERSTKCGINGTHIRVTVHGEEETEHMHAHHHHHHGSMRDIRSIVSSLAIPTMVKLDIMSVYEEIAQAESHAHGVPVEQIHFHEVGTMDAIENVALPLAFQGIPKAIRNRKAIEVLKLVGLSKHMKHRPNQMSGGQQQRVGVARAMVVEPEIIFADEPTGNLDSNTSVEVMNLMKQVVREKNQTLVMVTHDNYLASFADIILRIRDGKIIDIEDHREENREICEITTQKDS